MGSYSNLPWSGCLQKVAGDESTSRASCKGSLTIDVACKKHLVDLILADFCLESIVGVSKGGVGDCLKKSCNLLFEETRTRNGVCTMLLVSSAWHRTLKLAKCHLLVINPLHVEFRFSGIFCGWLSLNCSNEHVDIHWGRTSQLRDGLFVSKQSCQSSECQQSHNTQDLLVVV